MGSFLSKQLTNILFISLVVLCALTLMIVSRCNEDTEVVLEATPSPTAAPTKTPKPSFVGVPKAVLETHLLVSEQYAALCDTSKENTWSLCVDGDRVNAATLFFTLDEGNVSLMELSIALPLDAEEPDDSKKKTKETPPQSSIEERLAQDGETVAVVSPDELLRALLPDLLSSCDRDGAIAQANIRLWTESAIDAMLGGKSYKVDGDGCKFQAVTTMRGGRDTFVCTLYAD